MPGENMNAKMATESKALTKHWQNAIVIQPKWQGETSATKRSHQ
jgi:hypothetical protein